MSGQTYYFDLYRNIDDRLNEFPPIKLTAWRKLHYGCQSGDDLLNCLLFSYSQMQDSTEFC